MQILPVFLPLVAAFYWLRIRYVKTSREIKRWEAVTRCERGARAEERVGQGGEGTTVAKKQGDQALGGCYQVREGGEGGEGEGWVGLQG